MVNLRVSLGKSNKTQACNKGDSTKISSDTYPQGIIKKRSGPREEGGWHIRAPTDERPYNRHAEFPEDHA